MAFVERKYCPICEKETIYVNGSCKECSDRKQREKQAIWEIKTQEEKITDLNNRVKKLEELVIASNLHGKITY